MRSPVRLVLRSATLVALLLSAGPAFAQDEPAKPGPPGAAPATEPAPPTPPAEPPAAPTPEPAVAPAPAAPVRADADRPTAAAGDEAPIRRSEGIRLGLDLDFQRAFSGSEDRLNAGSPSLIPIGFDVSFHTSPKVLFGLHGYAALASRDDCISADSCRARAYGFGGHVETTLSSTARSFVPWLRYGVGYELLYQGGLPLDASGHIYRGAVDLLDLRIGGDFIVSRGPDGKAAAIGPYAGLVGGFLVNQSGITQRNGIGGQPRNLDRDSGSAHLWFVLGVRGTLDP